MRYVGDGQKIKNYFSSFRDFSGKVDSVIMLGFECSINAQNLIKIVRARFEKFKILNFFLMRTTLNFRDRAKTRKTARDIYKRALDIEFEGDRLIGLGSTYIICGLYDRLRTDRRTHTHTHMHTFFPKHIFRPWE